MEDVENGFFLGWESGRRVRHSFRNVMVVRRTNSTPALVSERRRSLCWRTLSASDLFQKQANPVPRERPVALSTVIRAYRNGPNTRKLRDAVESQTNVDENDDRTYSVRSSSSVAVNGTFRTKTVVPLSGAGN